MFKWLTSYACNACDVITCTLTAAYTISHDTQLQKDHGFKSSSMPEMSVQIYINLAASLHVSSSSCCVFFPLLFCVQSPSAMELWMMVAGSGDSWRPLVHALHVGGLGQMVAE